MTKPWIRAHVFTDSSRKLYFSKVQHFPGGGGNFFGSNGFFPKETHFPGGSGPPALPPPLDPRINGNIKGAAQPVQPSRLISAVDVCSPKMYA